MKGVSRLREKNPGVVLIGFAMAVVALGVFGWFVLQRLNGAGAAQSNYGVPIQWLWKLFGAAGFVGLLRFLLNKTWRKQDKKIAVLLRKRSEINKSIARGILDEVIKIDRQWSLAAVLSGRDFRQNDRAQIIDLLSAATRRDGKPHFRSERENVSFVFDAIDFPSEDELRRKSESEQSALENAAVALNNRLLGIARSRDYHAVVVRPIILNERFRRAVERLLEAGVFVVILEIEPVALPLPSGLPIEPVFLTPDHDEAGRKLGEFVNNVLDRDRETALLVLAGPANDPAARVRSSALLWEVLGTTQHPKVRVEVIESWGREDKPEKVREALSAWLRDEGPIFGKAIVYAGSDGIVRKLCEHNSETEQRLGISIKYVSIDGSRSGDGRELDLQSQQACLATVDVSPQMQGATAVGIILNERLGKNAARFTPLETSRIVFERAGS